MRRSAGPSALDTFCDDASATLRSPLLTDGASPLFCGWIECPVKEEASDREAREGGGGFQGGGAVLLVALADDLGFGGFEGAKGFEAGGEVEDVGEVEGVARGFLLDLFAAGEAVGEDDGLFARRRGRWEGARRSPHLIETS